MVINHLMGMEANFQGLLGNSWRGYYERDTRVLSNWDMLRGVNDTVITLLPQRRHAENVNCMLQQNIQGDLKNAVQ